MLNLCSPNLLPQGSLLSLTFWQSDGRFRAISLPRKEGNAAHGEIIAKRWCSACHSVASDQARANSDAPPFASIARKKQASELKGFLTDPHPKMPNMSLSRSEIADIVAYIKTLDR